MHRRRLIERERAASYLFTMLLAFALSILVTRLFLELSGYPQIGNEQLHIAHVLWGGLIAAVGATLPLIFANTFVLEISAALSGLGLGLFFDEVGKFLTQNNDYFFRPAASVIYVLFLLGVYVYITVRRGEPDAQTRLHHALAAMQEVVDGDLDPQEKADLERMLRATAGAERAIPDVRELAEALLGFVREQADVVPARPAPLRDGLRSARAWVESSLLTRGTLRFLVILSTALLGLLSLADMASLLRGLGSPSQMDRLVGAWVARASLSSGQEATWFALMIGLKAVVGVALLIALVQMLRGHEERAIPFALVGLLLSITTVDVLLFYFEQFIAAAYVAIDFLLIAALNFYRRRYLPVDSPAGVEQT
jgi:hypothetical protein